MKREGGIDTVAHTLNSEDKRATHKGIKEMISFFCSYFYFDHFAGDGSKPWWRRRGECGWCKRNEMLYSICTCISEYTTKYTLNWVLTTRSRCTTTTKPSQEEIKTKNSEQNRNILLWCRLFSPFTATSLTWLLSLLSATLELLLRYHLTSFVVYTRWCWVLWPRSTQLMCVSFSTREIDTYTFENYYKMCAY